MSLDACFCSFFSFPLGFYKSRALLCIQPMSCFARSASHGDDFSCGLPRSPNCFLSIEHVAFPSVSDSWILSPGLACYGKPRPSFQSWGLAWWDYASSVLGPRVEGVWGGCILNPPGQREARSMSRSAPRVPGGEPLSELVSRIIAGPPPGRSAPQSWGHLCWLSPRLLQQTPLTNPPCTHTGVCAPCLCRRTL